MSRTILGRRVALDQLPVPGFKPAWAELTGWGRMRRVLFWTAQVGQIGLLSAAMTSGSDHNIAADGTKQRPTDKNEADGGSAS